METLPSPAPKKRRIPVSSSPHTAPYLGKKNPKICALIAYNLGFRKLAQLAEDLRNVSRFQYLKLILQHLTDS